MIGRRNQHQGFREARKVGHLAALWAGNNHEVLRSTQARPPRCSSETMIAIPTARLRDVAQCPRIESAGAPRYSQGVTRAF